MSRFKPGDVVHVVHPQERFGIGAMLFDRALRVVRVECEGKPGCFYDRVYLDTAHIAGLPAEVPVFDRELNIVKNVTT